MMERKLELVNIKTPEKFNEKQLRIKKYKKFYLKSVMSFQS